MRQKVGRAPFRSCSYSVSIGSMYAIYGNIWGILMGSMLSYMASPWILWGINRETNNCLRFSPQDLALKPSSEKCYCLRKLSEDDLVKSGNIHRVSPRYWEARGEVTMPVCRSRSLQHIATIVWNIDGSLECTLTY